MAVVRGGSVVTWQLDHSEGAANASRAAARRRTQARVSGEAAEQALERYRAGAATQLDLLQAQRDALAAEASRIQADANLVNSRAQLRTAAGRRLL
jgi:outer membrane protein TolC